MSKGMKKWGILFLLIGVAVYLFMGHSFNIKTYEHYEVVQNYDIKNNSKIQYGAYKDQYIVSVSQDGTKLMTLEGRSLWDQAYTMQNPKMIIQGDYIAVGDIKGNHIYLFEEAGIINRIDTNYPIIDFELNKNGFVAVVEENDLEHNFYLYQKDGETITSGKTYFDTNGYPLDFALSEDGTKLVTSYFFTDGTVSENRLTFYNFSSIGENYTDRLVGAALKEESIVPFVYFLGNENIVAFGNQEMTFYEMEYRPEEITSIDFEEEVKSIVVSEEYLGIVNGQGETKYLRLYSKLGKEIRDITIDLDYEEIIGTEDSVVVYNEWMCKVYTMSGQLRWEETFDYAIQQIIPFKDQQYLIVTANELKMIKLY